MTNSNGIRSFRIDIPQSELDDLHDRLMRTRWPRDLGGPESDRGVPTRTVRPLADYWRDQFDWRAQEARLNAYPQFVTDVDGQQIHFVHVRSAVPGARPLVLLHGWPSSFVEFLDLVGPLTDPVAHGGRAEDAMHVVVPSLPGYGFSSLSGPGWGELTRVAQAIAEVMHRLGYDRFLAQGTDAGAGVVSMLPMIAPGRVIATHVNGPGPFPLGPDVAADGLNEADAERAARFNAFRAEGAGYLHIQSTRPQTVAYGLNDSPVAQLAWIVEKYEEWSDPATATAEDAVGLDRLLTTVSLYWFQQAGWSSAHAVYEGMQVFRQFAAAQSENSNRSWGGGSGSEAGEESWGREDGGWQAPPAPPAAVSVFAADFSIRSIVDPAGTIKTWTEHDRGGHFPAMETPQLLLADIRAFFAEHH